MNNETCLDIIILVVEDDELLNKSIRRLLDREGMRSEGFLSGSLFLSRPLSATDNILLLLDYTLPDMTGKEIIAKLKDRGLDIPFVIVTGHGDELLAVEMMKLGAMDYIVKALQFHEILPAKVKHVCREIANRKKLAEAETELRESEEKQKHLEDQLRQSQKLEAIGQLAGGVAHDFNNLLGGIMGNAELIKMHKAIDPEICRYADRIIQASTKAADLTGQLLAFARKARVNYTRINIQARIENAIELLKHTIDRKIEIVTRFTTEPSFVLGDANMLENALLNIAINARDAMPNGGTLTFETNMVTLTKNIFPCDTEDLVPGEYIRIAITDTGTGIDKETQKRIFEPFFTTKEAGKGTGLGLAAVYGCVCQHKGQIKLESEIGIGTTFTILLPLVLPELLSEIPVDSVCVNGHGNVLVVDDEKVVGDTLGEILKSLGYSPNVFCDPLEAIDYFKINYKTISAVILDLIMPKMSGLDLFRAFKKLKPGIKVIVASGYSDNNQEKLVMQEGAMEFVEKPYKVYEMSKALSRVLGDEGK